MARSLVLHCRLNPSDALAVTAAVESLHARYSKEYKTDVRTSVPEIWRHNPWITPLEDDEAEHVELEQPPINKSKSLLSPFLEGYTRDLGHRLGVPLELTTNRPHLYLSDDEKVWINQVHEDITDGRDIPFWLVNAGVTSDCTAKQWPIEHYQAVIDATHGLIQWVQIGSAEHQHTPLHGVIDFIGKTDQRELIRLAYHAQGGLGPATYLQHLMAAWEKPYLCLLGGRESVARVNYPRQHLLHTMGMLACCATGPCWRARVAPLGDGEAHDQSLCDQPVLGWARPSAQCMAIIQPSEVIAVLSRILASQERSLQYK